jgi:anthranilate 1,2-dioxygenase large subunit
MNAAETATQEKIWPGEGVNRIPAWIYSDEALFEREMEKFFAGDTWNFVGLEAEIPEPGSYQRTFIGLKPVLIEKAAKLGGVF